MADEKQYQSLYRKYRPQGPGEILGQEHVVRALEGAVTEGRLAHAFLFTGPRGTGKTSTARILAKMVNCEHGPTATPCGVCDQCIRIREGQHLDVVEIDAASHGGVDDARELRERAPTAPAMAREKIYIIDEAQRLSREAFDALLKVFEEPPPGVRFVLATTEPHKMPATIVGRCQRFDFRRVPAELLAGHLEAIAKQEGLTLPPEAAEMIARHSEGSVRDSLSLLDQASVLGGGTIGTEVLDALLGGSQAETRFEIADAVAVGDARGIFGIVNRLVQQGQDLRHVTAETLTHFRNLLIVHTAPGQNDLLDATEDEVDRLRAQAAKYSPAEISRVITLLLAAQADMRWTTSPRLTVELALVRASLPETDPHPAALISRLERLERVSGVEVPVGGDDAGVARAASLPRPASPGSEPPLVPASSPERASKPATKPSRAAKKPSPEARAKTSAVKSAATNVDVETIRKAWPQLIQHLRSSRQMILATNLESVTPMAFDGETLELVFPPDRHFGIKKVADKEDELRALLQEMFGIAPKIVCATRDSVGGVPAADAEVEDGPISEAEALARVQEALGAEVAPELEGS